MRKLLVLGGLAAAAAFVAKKLTADEQSVWHTPDTDPEPYEPPEPPLSVVPEAADDAAGASPDEALADSVEEPHAATTPDAPLSETPVKDD